MTDRRDNCDPPDGWVTTSREITYPAAHRWTDPVEPATDLAHTQVDTLGSE